MKMVGAKIKMFLVLSGAKRSRRTRASYAALQGHSASFDFAQGRADFLLGIFHSIVEAAA